MMTTAQSQHQQDHKSPYHSLAANTYDPDEVVPRDSPLMKALHPRLELSPSPPPDIPLAQVSLSPPPYDGRFKSNRPKIRPHSGDAVLVASLDNGRRPEIAQAAGNESLPGPGRMTGDDVDDESEFESDPLGHRPPHSSVPRSLAHPSFRHMNSSIPSVANMAAGPNLQHLAAGALDAVSSGPSRSPAPKHLSDISVSTRQLSISDDPPFPSKSHVPPPMHLKPETKTIPAMLSPTSGELPPLQMDSPKSESNGQSLPSIRSTLGDLNRLPGEPPTPSESDMPSLHGSSVFSRSPPVSMPRLPPMPASHVSPPISPRETYQRSLPSPHSLPASSPYYFPTSSGRHQRPSVDYSNSGSGETPGSDQSASTPATSSTVADRMSIDGITNSQVGGYVCQYSGCNAPPFQTQYLLNSHANVHSSARPHYCPVQGCPRSEGGKGFKRKNEMIRHGLVHDSPGYVCPFCPDREHKYPRPDNLQRHVRVHHVDKDKDDPMLRDVLAQRPDGPNRGRRRRGPL